MIRYTKLLYNNSFKGGDKMSRRERKNMIDYILMVKGGDKRNFIYMTDQDIEHIYETVYSRHETIE